MDLEGHIATWNRGAQKIKGYQKEEIIGGNFRCFYTPEDLKNGRPERLLSTAYSKGKAVDEGWRVRKDGTTFWGNVTITAIHDDQGTVTGFGKLTRDLTQRKLVEHVAKHAPAMLAYWDKNLRCKFANNAYCDWFGKTSSEMIDVIALQDLLGPLYKKNEILINTVLQGQPVTFERHIISAAQRSIHALVQYYPDTDSTTGVVSGFFVHVSDISTIKQLEQEKILNRELEVKNKELEQFNYIASHDLQEPLRTVSNYIQILEEDHHGQIDDTGKEYLRVINSATDRMKILVRSLLDYSRIGKNAELKLTNLEHLLKQVTADLNASIAEKKAVVRIGSMPVMKVYETEIRQLFQNLISNALKFQPADNVPQIDITAEEQAGHYLFTIRDNGIGIPAEYLQKIFFIFQKLHNSGYSGYGIGLANCKKITEMHGGKIWAESEPGQGSTFKFTILKLNV